MLKYIGYIEICVGLGLGLGPMISAFVFEALEYSGTMYLFAALNAIGTFITIIMLPNELNQSVT
jgi:hypothetical protein